MNQNKEKMQKPIKTDFKYFLTRSLGKLVKNTEKENY